MRGMWVKVPFVWDLHKQPRIVCLTIGHISSVLLTAPTGVATSHEYLTVSYNACNKTILECSEGPHFCVFLSK